jgi:hypothetical protein
MLRLNLAAARNAVPPPAAKAESCCNSISVQGLLFMIDFQRHGRADNSGKISSFLCPGVDMSSCWTACAIFLNEYGREDESYEATK